MMARINRWLNAKSPLFSRLCGEDFTRKEVVCAHIGCILFIILLGIIGTLEEGGAL